MPISFTTTEHFPLSREQVFEGLTNLNNAHKWMNGFIRIEPIKGTRIEPGAVWRETRKLYGREATEEFEVTGIIPNREINLRVDGSKGTSKKGIFIFQYILNDNNNGTDVTLNGEVQGLKGITALVFKLFSGSFKKACVKDLVNLRTYLTKQA